MTNDFYGIDGGGIVAAPKLIWPNLRQPTEGEYNARGYYRLANDEPQPGEGEVVTGTGYEVRDGLIHTVYTYSPAPAPAPRQWTRLAVISTLEAKGLWEAAKELMGDDIIKLLACDYVREDYPAFAAAVAQAREQLGAETVDALLDAIPAEAN